MSADYSRDLIGYAENPPHPQWPSDARIALSFVLNYEEGGERCVLHLVDGSRHDGVLQRVGADFVEVVGAGRPVVLVATDGLAAVQSRDDG